MHEINHVINTIWRLFIYYVYIVLTSNNLIWDIISSFCVWMIWFQSFECARAGLTHSMT